MTVFRRKVCRRCGEDKVVSKINFYRNAGSADGFLNICKPCKRFEIEENRILKSDYYREQDRVRNTRPDRVAARLAYAKTPAGQLSRRRADQRYRMFRRLEARA